MVFQLYMFISSYTYICVCMYIHTFIYTYLYLSELNYLLIGINTMCCLPPVHCVCFVVLQSNPKCKQVPFSW